VADDNQRPIVIRKVKGGHGHGHHGGAWKVAYADFVTAMMAFFLLLWLLNVSTEEQLSGLADYFAPTLVSTSDKSGAAQILSGSSLQNDGNLRSGSRTVLEVPPRPDPDTQGAQTPTKEQILNYLRAQDEQRFQAAEARLRKAIRERSELKSALDNVIIDRTPEGLRIQLVDREGQPLFRSGSAGLPDHTRRIVGAVAEAIREMPNHVSISGHTDSVPFAGGGEDYTNWELSSDRANASRRVLLAGGLARPRIARVVGKAAREPLLPEQPRAAQNRRIAITLLYRDEGSAAAEALRRGSGLDGGGMRRPAREPAPALRPAPAPLPSGG